MITLHQDADGFIRMNRHFPTKTPVSIIFSDGSQESFVGEQVNAVYDQAQAEYRAENRLDAKGFSRRPAKTVQPMKDGITFVKVRPGLAEA
ncbi:hypothetical protein JF66_13695 [Cryobacterium sp. MLB-32]|uniref:hypothetical protein n=1 Tax=Cryobacterium sp. MLB-32 TaxID=1529318 RepID=UPI0004E7110C|nr:hypothetical protein [Cryobacterium sp. MLB-32]KFF59106.1 hypothetical protein JF66_13695 [Cryobacterium sp. MLB-32]